MALDLLCDTTEYFTGNGSRTDFNLGFDFMEPSDVRVGFFSPVVGVYQDKAADDPVYGYTVELVPGGSLVRFVEPVEAQQKIIIYRLTPVDPIKADFEAGHPIKAQDLDDNFEQLANAIEDTRCIVEGLIQGEFDPGSDVYWKKYGETIYSNNAWDPCDCYIASAKAVELRLQRLVSMGINPPATPNWNGQLWWDTDDGNLYIYYKDGDSQQWVSASASLGDAPQDGNIYARQDGQWSLIYDDDGNPALSDVPASPYGRHYARTSAVDANSDNTWTLLADVALSGDFNDLTNAPTIPTVPAPLFTRTTTNLVSYLTPATTSDTLSLYGPLTIDTNKAVLALDGSATFANVVESTSGGFKFPDGTTQISAVTSSDLTAYVEAGGDNMTGNLTLGTNNIVLDAGDGSASFASDVGIGTNSPLYALDVRTSGTNNGQLKVGGSSTATGLLLEQTNSGSTAANIQNSYYATSASASLSIKSGFTTFHTGTAGDTRMKIDSSGNVGVGTTSVSAALHVVKDVNPVLKLDRGTANTANANWYYNGTLTGQLSAANADFQISAAGASTPMSFYVNGSQRMQISDNGTTTFAGDLSINDSSFIRVRQTGDNTSTAIQLSHDGSGEYNSYIQSNRFAIKSALSSNVNGTDYAFAAFDGSSNLKVGIQTDGSATFVGPVEVKQNLASTFGTESFVVSNASQNQVIRLNNNGSATFNQRVTSGSTSNRGQFLGTCPSSVTASSADAFVADYNGATVYRVKYDGSGEFNGRVKSDSYFESNRTNATGSAFYATLNGVAGVDIKANGSATFAGRGDFGSSSHNTTHAVQAQNNKSDRSTVLAIQHNSSGPVFEGRNGAVSTTAATSTIKADGAATFAGIVDSDKFFRSTRTASNGGELFFQGKVGSSTNCSIAADGSAVFSGSVKGTRGIFRNNSNSSLIVGVDNINDANYSAIQLKPDGEISAGGSALFDGNVYAGYDTYPNTGVKVGADGNITATGTVLIGKTANTFSVAGHVLNANGSFDATRQSAPSIFINRTGTDGPLVHLYHAGNLEGNISVSGSTVSYNGGHLSRWSQLPGGVDRTEILRGSVLSNLDEMCEWAYEAQDAVLYTEDDELPEGVSVGDVKEPARDAGSEDNEQLNRMKVSDVEGDRNVAGVFQCWDDDDDVYTNDFYCAMTGDFIIRIAQGTTVERGDLLMSAGDGTAKPQDDDIVRSKTIAKVTSTTMRRSIRRNDGRWSSP